jgi:putative ABC transport system permease protein
MSITRDIRDAWRGLRHDRGFSIAALVMLALGIAASSAIFAAIEAVVLELPFDKPDRVVTVRARAEEGGVVFISPRQFEAWRDVPGIFDAIAAYTLDSPVMTRRDVAVRLQAEAMTASMFAVLGVQPALGRTFRDDDGAVVVLSDGFWRSTFGADPGVLGRPIVLDGIPTVVVGVMPPGFDGPRSRPGDGWLPFSTARPGNPRRPPTVTVLGRLAAGVSVQQAAARLEAVRVEAGRGRWSVLLETAREDFLYQDALQSLRLLIAGVALVLFMACVNVVSLLLGRNVSRRRELAVRLALGAQRRHIVRQVALESLLLSFAAAVLGLLLARWAVTAMVPLIPRWFPRIAQVDVDWRVAAFTALAAVVTGLAVAIWPARSASRHDLTAVMNAGGRGTSAGARRARSALVVVEATLAMVVLTTAAMIVGSFNRLNPTSPGFEVADRTKFSVRLESERYRERGARIAAVEDIVARLKRLPGVVDVSSATNLPLTTTTTFPTRVNGAPITGARTPTVHFRAALPNYFAVMGMRIVAGRGLSADDAAGAPPIAVVNQTLVARLLSGRDPLAAELVIDEPDGAVVRRVVGVVTDVRASGSHLRGWPEVFVPHAQSPLALASFVVKSSAGGTPIEAGIRGALGAFDPALPVDRVESLEAVASRSVATQRFLAMLVGAFAAVAVALAFVGLYAVAAWSVTQRTREMGVRLALGATAADIRSLVLRYGAAVGCTGAIAGALGAYFSTRVIERHLYGFDARQPIIYVALAFAFVAIVTLASYLPARRAMRIDPLAALRVE